MATQRFYLCPKCTFKIPAISLFSALSSIAKSSSPECAKCKSKMILHLQFAFGLGVKRMKCTVLDAFLPKEECTWDDKGRHVQFFPFLVIASSEDNSKRTWLPYWHIVTENGLESQKYGQWAPNMDISLFSDLITQAKAKGYLK